MRFVQIETLPAGKALVDIDKLTHAVSEGQGSRLFLGAQHIDVPHSLSELRKRLGRSRANRRRREQHGGVRRPVKPVRQYAAPQSGAGLAATAQRTRQEPK
jgi:hypothetical protein